MPLQKLDSLVVLWLARAVALSALACAGGRRIPGEPAPAGSAKARATATRIASTNPPASSAPSRASAPAEPDVETARPPDAQLVACDLGSRDVVRALAEYERKIAARERKSKADMGGMELGLSGIGEAWVTLSLEGVSVSHEAACPDVVTWFHNRNYVLSSCMKGYIVEQQAPRHVVEYFRFSDTGDVTVLEPKLAACYRRDDRYFSAYDLLPPWQHGGVDVSLMLVVEKNRSRDDGPGLGPLRRHR